MDLLKDRIRTVYFRYLIAAFASAFISSVYGVVDAAMVGQYQGPDGSAALAVVAPFWNIIYSLGLMAGIGGSVLFGTMKGKREKAERKPNECFTSALILTVLLSVISCLLLFFLEEPLLRFFGADDILLPLAESYLFPVRFAAPVFLFSQFLAAFLRNDNDPGLATRSVIYGGVFNVFGDYFFVFVLNLGMMGAGIATCLGASISVLVMISHFFRKKNTLKLETPKKLFSDFHAIFMNGFSSFFVDLVMGILTIVFNRQIIALLDNDSLSVYGIIINISTFVQCCAYSIGQASQPIVSVNYGAKNKKRISETLRYALITAFFFGIVWFLLAESILNGFVRLFMKPTDKILSIAPTIIRYYGISFLLLPFNIFSTYYFQAILKPRVAFFISILRGMLLSATLIFVLPVFLPIESIWFAMPITEVITAILVLVFLLRSQKNLFRRKARTAREKAKGQHPTAEIVFLKKVG